jgi:dienelactone hydrolase
MVQAAVIALMLLSASAAHALTPEEDAPVIDDMAGMAALYDDAIRRDTRPLEPDDIRAVTFPFPDPHGRGTRNVAVWRPPGELGVLPVLYMMDGFSGLTVVAHQIAPAIARGEAPPIMIVAPETRDARRLEEYVPSIRHPRPAFARHRDWLLRTIIPWSEQYMGASRDRMQRAIGGFSNGGDFAVAMAAQRPDLFGLILVHAPANPRDEWVLPSAATQRWVITGGTRDFDGEVARTLNRQLAQHRAYRRVCIGAWEHLVQPWRELSPGSTMWLFGYEEAAERIASERERQTCVAYRD